MMEYLLNHILTSLHITTYGGAICGHMLSLNATKLSGTKPFFEKILPNKSSSFYHRLDFAVLPLIGAFLGLSLLDPMSVKAAIFAGLCWSTSITALSKKEELN